MIYMYQLLAVIIKNLLVSETVLVILQCSGSSHKQTDAFGM